MNDEQLADWIDESATLEEFLARLAQQFAASRHREMQVFAEKTPINVSSAEHFCKHFPDGLFVHVVRDGRAVVGSLLRRGFPLYAAALTWMTQTMAGRDASRQFTNTVTVRFEDLVQAPFETAASIAGRLGVATDANAIQQRFQTNAFRAGLRRVASWSIREYSGNIETPPPYTDQLSAAQIRLLESLRLYHLEPNATARPGQRFADLLGDYGYPLPSSGAQHDVPVDQWIRAYSDYLAEGKFAFRLRHDRRKLLIEPCRCRGLVACGAAACKSWLLDKRHFRWPARLTAFLKNRPRVLAQMMLISELETKLLTKTE